jgi:hypothetical protein
MARYNKTIPIPDSIVFAHLPALLSFFTTGVSCICILSSISILLFFVCRRSLYRSSVYRRTLCRRSTYFMNRDYHTICRLSTYNFEIHKKRDATACHASQNTHKTYTLSTFNRLVFPDVSSGTPATMTTTSPFSTTSICLAHAMAC